jgi:hypothetical protein
MISWRRATIACRRGTLAALVNQVAALLVDPVLLFEDMR